MLLYFKACWTRNIWGHRVIPFTLEKVFLRSIRSASHRRVDWLVHQLIIVVHIFYWWRECGKEIGFHGNFRVEKIEAQSWLRAQSIPDDNVTLHQSDPSMAWVQSQHDEMKIYMVWQSGPNFAMCNCNWEKMDICANMSLRLP